MALVTHQSAESLLRSLSGLSETDLAACSPDLIEKARRLLQSATFQSAASQHRPQDVSNEADANPVAQQPAKISKSEKLYAALLRTQKTATALLDIGARNAIRSQLSSAYDPRVQDLQAGLCSQRSKSQRLRHVLCLPLWLQEYEAFKNRFPGPHGSIRKFAATRGLTDREAREGVLRGNKIRHIITCFRKPALSVPLAFIVGEWRRLANEDLEEAARLCHSDKSFAEFVEGLSKFFEKCRDEYAVFLTKRLTATRRPFEWIRFEARSCLISSNGEESTTARASETTKESEEHEIRTGKAIQYYLVRKADSCSGRASRRLLITAGDAPAEEPPVVEACSLTNAHHPNDRLPVHASFNNIGSNAVFEAHNCLPRDGMYNSLAGDHGVVMQEYNHESTPQQQGTGTAQSDGLPWEQTGNPPPNLLAWVPPQQSTDIDQGTDIDQSTGLPWEQTGNPPPDLLAWVPPQQSRGIDQNTGLPWEQIGSLRQDYVAWRPKELNRTTTSDPSRAYELEGVDMTPDNSLSLDPALFLQQSALGWWANPEAALA